MWVRDRPIDVCFTSDAQNDYIESKAETPYPGTILWDDRSLTVKGDNLSHAVFQLS